MTFETSALVAAWLMILLLAFALAGVMRQLQFLTNAPSQDRRRVGPAIGSRLTAPQITSGKVVSILLFLDSDCVTCEWVLPDVAQKKEEFGDLFFVAVYRGEHNGLPTHPIAVLENQKHVFEQFNVAATPFGVAITNGGVVLAADALGSPPMLSNLVEVARERRPNEPQT